MAKQSWKQQMYQSIANSQVQQVMQQQRDQGIAQLQAEFDAWQKQQNDIAQLQAEYDSWYAQNNPQPVQSAPVQTVKKSAPKQEAIPSLADFFKPTTASGKDVNKEAVAKLSEDEARIQEQRAKRKEAVNNTLNMLNTKDFKDTAKKGKAQRAIAQKPAKEQLENAIKQQTEDTQPTSTRDIFGAGSTPTNNIKGMLTQQPEKKPSVIEPSEQTASNTQFDEVAKIVEDAAKDWAPWFTYRGSKWENPYDSMTPEQQQIVRDYVQQNKNNPNLSEDERKRLGDFLKVYGGSGDVEDYNDIATAYNNTFSDRMQTLRAGIGGFVNANKPVADLMAKGASKLPIMGQAIDLDEAEKAYDASVTNAMDKNRAAAEIGRGAGQIYDYLITSPVIGAATSAIGLSGLGAAAVNQLFQAGQDVALDVYPEAQRMLKEEGEINWGELAKRFGTDVALNVAMQVIPSLRGVNYDYLTKTVGNNADIFKNMTQSGAYKNIPDIANSIANAASDIKANEAPVENVAKTQMIPGMETESAVVDDINRQFSDLMSNYHPETSAMRNIYNADDLNTSLNEQLANAIKASQADEAIESAAKAMPEAPVNEVANNVDEVAEAVNNISPIKNDIDEMSDAVTNRILDVGYKVDAANNEVLSKSYRELLDYEERWAKTVSESTDIEEIRQATKDLNNAISRFNTRAKKVDPSIAKDIYNRKFSSMLNSFNTKLDDFYNGARRSEEAANLIVGDTGAKNTIEDMARQQVAEATNGFPEELKKLVEDRRHAAWEYGWAEGESVFSTGKRLDNIDKQIKEKYPEYVSQIYDDRGYFKNDLFDVEAVKDRLSKTMAEDTGIPKGTPEPESVKATYQIPDTPENAPTEARPVVSENVPPESGDYVSQFRTNNEHRFNLTDEELNNKYFSTDNENFHFIKGDRGADLDKATANLEADYDGTVNKILNKSTDTQFTPQEVDEGFMAWNKELGTARETGDYSKSADIMYRLTRDAHDKGAGLQAYATWKKNSPAGVVLDATSQARRMAEDQFGRAYLNTLDDLTDSIDSICKSSDTLDIKIKKLKNLLKEAEAKGYKNGISGGEQLQELLASNNNVSVSNIHDILYEANKVPNLSAASQQQIADIASQMYGKELTSAEKRRYINQINMILSQEKHWSIKDKAIEISHILMLSGTRTHLKNFVANVGMLPQEALARKISAIGQNAYKHFVDPNYKPTQAFRVSKEARALAAESYAAKGGANAIAEGLADKFTNQMSDQIGANYMFGVGRENILSRANRAATNAIPGLKKAEDAAGNLTNKVLTRIGSEGAYDAMDANASLLENYRQFIYGSLSGLEDNPFVKSNYINRLASYIQAQGFKSLDEIPEEAFDIARAEALKATFKDDNTITELFKKIKNLPVVGELTFPFVKTPANLLARSIDFSPIGLARSLYGAINKNSRFAKETIGETIDEIAKGLGGTGTMALGMWLYANGLITGKASDDPELANYMSNEGWQQYSISSKGVSDFINSRLGTDVDLGDNYYDFSFMQPSTTNMIAAEEVWDELMDGKKLTEKDMDSVFNRVKSVAGSYTDALLAQSTMQNVADLFGSQYTDDGVGGNLIQTALEWPTRFTSGALNDMAKLGDDTKREYYSKNKPLETVKNAVVSKVPGLSKTLPAKYDVFGEEITRNKTEGQKWFNTLLNPSSTTQRNDNPLYNYVDSINEQSTSGDYIPDKTLRKIKLNDETEYSLDNKEYSEASRIAGEVRSSFLKDTKSNGLFKSLSADDKANILNNLEKVAVSTAYTSINENARVSEETQKYMDMYKEGGVDAVVKDYVGKQIVKDTGISSGSNAADAIKEAVAKGNMAEAQRLAKTEKDYLAACEKAGIEKRSEATRKIYEDEGVKGLQQYAKDAKTFESHGVEFNETTRGIYKDYGEKGLDEYKALADSGLKNKKPMTIYQSAKKDVSRSELPTLEKYAETYKKIDTGSNGEIDQKEFIAYALSQGWSQSQIETQAKIYGDWKTIPVLEKGNITFKKKKK